MVNPIWTKLKNELIDSQKQVIIAENNLKIDIENRNQMLEYQVNEKMRRESLLKPKSK